MGREQAIFVANLPGQVTRAGINPADFRSRSQNTPIAGWELVGRVQRTLVGGELRFDRSAIEG